MERPKDVPRSWKEKGFLSPPRLELAKGGEIVYRVYGGRSYIAGNPEGQGVCFSFDRARSRLDAERLYSAAEWGNSFRGIASFKVPRGTPLWVGRVDPGTSSLPNLRLTGSQVFIENPWAQTLQRVEVAHLPGDLGPYWVYTGPRPATDEAACRDSN